MSRKGSSGMSSGASGNTRGTESAGSNGSGVKSVFGGRSANEVAYKAISDMKYSGSPQGKYDAVESIANGNPDIVAKATLSPREIIRTQAAASNPDLVNGRGNRQTWKPGGEEALYNRLGSSGVQQLQSALQTQAQRWLRENPMITNYRKKGYKWDGTKFVRK